MEEKNTKNHSNSCECPECDKNREMNCGACCCCCGKKHRLFLLKIFISIALFAVIFAFGVKIGELKNSIYGGYGIFSNHHGYPMVESQNKYFDCLMREKILNQCEKSQTESSDTTIVPQ